jgi:TldD protein
MRLSSLTWTVAVLAAACGSGSRPPKGPGGSSATIAPIDLPAVPAKLTTTASAPTDGNSPDARSPVLDILTSENKRWMDVLSKKDDPAFYLQYQVVEQRIVNLEAEGGAVVTDSDESARNLDVEIHVGSPELDNTRPLSDDPNGFNTPLARRGIIPFGEDPQAVASHLWLETDRRYREAVQALAYVRQDQSTLKKRTKVPDYSAAPAEVYVEKVTTLDFDKADWIGRLKRCSARTYRGVATRGSCGVVFTQNTVYLVNSEGTQLQLSWTSAQFSVSVGVKADDGMNLSRLEQRFGRTPADLPPEKDLEAIITTVTADLDALHAAPLAEPYAGPAILEGRAAAVFVHEVFGHRIEGHRQKDEAGGQTFASQVGKEIMPDWLSVHDDPTLLTANGHQLNGFYRFDDEGVRARRTPLVESGKLVGFLMSRNPIDKFPTSNGHGRRQPGFDPVARQGNLIVQSTHSVEREQMEKLLIEEIKKQRRPYGMVFTDIAGGFTNTSAFGAQSFKVNPVMAYRIYPDGRRELVRGIDISGTPLVALQSIRAASREIETFNGICGAESGWVPVSASAPSLLIEKLEVERSFTPPDRPPVLNPPALRTAGGAQ